MLKKYIKAAMSKAHYELLPNDGASILCDKIHVRWTYGPDLTTISSL